MFGGLPVRFGSFLPAVDLFDAAAFATSDAEALLMDPQQRLLLEAVGELLLSQAGSTGMEPAARRDVGVFVGLSTVDYLKVGSRAPACMPSLRRGSVATRASCLTEWIAH